MRRFLSTAAKIPPPWPKFNISSEVRTAIRNAEPIVALESTIITHGMPYPANVETARAVEAKVRAGGAVPATIAVLDGVISVGLSGEDLERLGRMGPAAVKCSTRDLGPVIASGGCASTTVAATMCVSICVAGLASFAREHAMFRDASLRSHVYTRISAACVTLEFTHSHSMCFEQGHR